MIFWYWQLAHIIAASAAAEQRDSTQRKCQCRRDSVIAAEYIPDRKQQQRGQKQREHEHEMYVRTHFHQLRIHFSFWCPLILFHSLAASQCARTVGIKQNGTNNAHTIGRIECKEATTMRLAVSLCGTAT